MYTYPENPQVDQAAFSMAAAYLELDQLEQAASWCQQAIKRYPQSALLDSYLYIKGYTHFKLRQYDQALKLCRRVAEEKFRTPSGELRPSENRYLATYIMGQIYHAMGQPEKAIEQYEKVKDRFADAKEAISYFRQRKLHLPEVTTIAKDDKPKVNLTYRNIKEARLLVYRVDLMKLYLIRKNLSTITDINLAGIKPYYETTLKLGEGKDYRDLKYEVELPLKKVGAYLVVAKSNEVDTSGMILVSNLKVEVQEDPVSGRMRVNVTDARTHQPVDEAHVKAIGEANKSFRSGYTDLRGVFCADDIRGRGTVIVRREEEYAFYRGRTVLQPALVRRPRRRVPPAAQRARRIMKEPKDLLMNVQQQQLKMSAENWKMLQQIYEKKQKGVQIRQAK
jgi:hypothetical protein